MSITPRQFEQIKARLSGPKRVAQPVFESSLRPRAAGTQIIIGIDPSLRGTGFGVIKMAGPHPVALLTLLGVCEELMRERRRMDGLRDKIRSKSSRILEMLEGVPRADEGNNPPAGGMSISVATEHGTP